MNRGFTLRDLEAIIESRSCADPSASHTASLLSQGVEACARKLGEEAVETVVAALREDDSRLAEESADLLYHLLVALRCRGVSLDSVMFALESRTSRSGVEEKASRVVEGRGEG